MKAMRKVQNLSEERTTSSFESSEREKENFPMNTLKSVEEELKLRLKNQETF